MPTLEVRRHSIRKTSGGSQLSQDGVDLARRLGQDMGPFAVVATSVVPRARETAIAMGFAVDQELITLSADPGFWTDVERSGWWRDPQPFKALKQTLSQPGSYRDYAHSMAALWRDLLTPLGPDDQALFIGHSGEIECALIACFPEEEHETAVRPLGPCEGARLTFGGHPAHWTAVEMIQVT